MVGAGQSLVILGAGGHGRVIASAARAAGWGAISFLDPNWPDLRVSGDWPVEASGDDLSVVGNRAVAVGVGNNARRLELMDQLAEAGLEVATVIHPRAWVCESVSVAPGTVIFAQAAVNPGSSLGRGVIVNTGAIIDHDGILAESVHISPGAALAGNVTVGRCAWVGTGASVRPGIRIGDRAVIGAGAAVVSDVPAGITVAGVPARPLD